ncbi:MAG: 2-amino-4-hydroxy-6-hydroxymethyldihydropteridine diphosphokinase [Firmicutes bacterium]|nr:2-amino-4-hydroxy-6-hydroxymethyldihydropteridine diphosphokinase [Bacillota bacterium]
MAAPVIAYLGLGSNLGDRLANLVAGVRLLSGAADIALVAVSSVYETAPWGLTDQPAFLNAVCAVRTALPPEALLRRCLEVEKALGRVRTVRWGPRTLDIDLLLYGDLTLQEPHLTLPHPRLTERAFVVIPLLEIAPDLTLPGGQPLAAFREAVAGQGIAPWQPAGAFWRQIQETGPRPRP